MNAEGELEDVGSGADDVDESGNGGNDGSRVGVVVGAPVGAGG